VFRDRSAEGAGGELVIEIGLVKLCLRDIEHSGSAGELAEGYFTRNLENDQVLSVVGPLVMEPAVDPRELAHGVV
jgi:hypothetical protein